MISRRAPFAVSLAAILALPLSTPGCGQKPPDAGASTGAPSGCHALAVTGLKSSSVAGWIEGVATTPDGSGPSQGYSLRIELDEIKGRTLSTGSFDLSKEPSYGDAMHAVLAWDGGDDPTTASTVFFQASGTMQLTAVSSPPTAESKGSLSGVTLVQSTIDATTYASTPTSGGSCLFIASTSWDTTVAAGTPCTVATDCGDTSKNVCDPTTKTCVPSECTSDATCGTGKSCIVEVTDSRAGACYSSCAPSASGGCPSGAECVAISYDGTQGICKSQGQTQEGGACSIEDVSTDCAAGMVCSPEHAGNLCRKQCDYFAKSAGACPASQHCVLGSVCSDEPIDPAAANQPCDGSSAETTPCALASGGQVAGICVAETGASGQVMMCRSVCRKSVATDCPTGQSCNDYYTSTGVCR